VTVSRPAGAGAPSAAVFALPESGHFRLLRPLISDLVQRGIDAHVFTDRRREREVELAGGKFVDLFAAHPLEDVDDESTPVPCRQVSFAGRYAEQIAADVEQLGASLVVYDTFAVIGRVVGRLLGVPYVNVSPGHNLDPSRILPRLESDPRVSISPACRRAVEVLRNRYGIEDASPFSYVSGLSPFLNLCCEPPAYLTEREQRVFQPLAFYGSLPAIEEMETLGRNRGASQFGCESSKLRVFVSFGTVVWRYWAAEALAALKVISESLAKMPNAHALISLGGAEIGAESVRALTKPNVRVESYVDQLKVLEEADVFVTHHGPGSTHEAIFNGVPMISYPFNIWDQPALAEKCRRLGLAIPLTDSLRGPVREEDVRAAFAELSRTRESMQSDLAQARDWELQVIADRDDVLRRITDLIPA
jgi:UDP:flavonoid glycosyltransferase YjiC (YdhE family)